MIVMFGRSPECTVRVDDEYVSPRHAAAEQRPDGTVVVTDLGSTNGTRIERDGVVAKVPMGASVPLLPGDVLLIGRTRIPWTRPGTGEGENRDAQ